MASYIFDPSKGETPAKLARQREIAAALMMGNRKAPQNVGEGLNAIGQALLYRSMMDKADAAQQAGLAQGQQSMQGIVDALGRGNFPAAPSPDGSVPLPETDMASARVAQAHGDAPASSGGFDVRQGLIERGMPEHIADAFVMNFQDESGLNPGINERNPVVPGSRGGFGLAQWTGPRRKALEAYAAERGMPVDDGNMQLDFLMSELQEPESRAWQAIQAAPSTGEAAAAIVNQFLRPAEQHRASREARYLRAPNTAGAQVASADPSIGLAAGPAQPPATESSLTPEALQAWAAQNYQPGQALPPSPGTQPRLPQQMPAPMPEQSMAPAQPAPAMPPAPPAADPRLEMSGNMDIPQPTGPTMQELVKALGDPWLPEEFRPVAQALLQQQMQQQDPRYGMQLEADRLGLEKSRLEIDAMRNPTPKDTDDIREYNYARQQGYQGSFTDFMTDMRRAGATSVNVGAGEKAWDQESAKLFAKRYDDISAGAMNAQQMMGMYDLAEQALNSGVRTGVGAEAELTLRQMGAAMGMDTDPEKLAGGELIRAVQNRMALTMRSPDGGMGMPGALSDRDIKFLKDSQIGIDRSPEGNRRMLEAFRAMENRKIEIARLADDYITQNGRLDSGFNQMVREYAQANPLFPEMESGGVPQAGQVVDGYRFKGGDPADPNSWERQ